MEVILGNLSLPLTSSSDLYGLQFALNNAGYRVCTYDYPGTGWSDPGVDAAQPMILDKIVAAIGEPGPFVLLVPPSFSNH